MKRPSRPARTPASLPESVYRQLNMYALAATAAGVGALALANAAEAKVIYTPAHRYVPLNSRLKIDFNHDGVTDLYIARRLFNQTNSTRSYFVTAVWASGEIVGYRSANRSTFTVASAFRAGQAIESDLKFYRSGGMAARGVTSQGADCGGGRFNNVKDRYLGIKFFDLRSRVHYGWVRISESCNRYGKRGTAARTLLTGYAYETIPGKAIITGKTEGSDDVAVELGSLGALAAGAPRRH